MVETASFEADDSLSQLLDRVERGEEITIMRRGRPVARLLPPFDRAVAREAADRIWERGKTATLGDDLTIKELIEDGRRF